MQWTSYSFNLICGVSDMAERTWEVKVEATTTREVIVHANTEYEAQIKAQIDMAGLVGGENTKVLSVKETTDDDA